MSENLTAVVEGLVVIIAIVMGVRLGGLGLGLWGAAGTAILIFAFKDTPGEPPISAFFIIIAVITASAAMQAAGGIDYLVGIYHACHRELCAHETNSPFKIVNFLELVGESMGVEKPDLFKQWKMMQDVDRVLAEVASQATSTGLDLETVRDVLVAHIINEQPLPVGFRGTPVASSDAAPVRVISE